MTTKIEMVVKMEGEQYKDTKFEGQGVVACCIHEEDGEGVETSFLMAGEITPTIILTSVSNVIQEAIINLIGDFGLTALEGIEAVDNACVDGISKAVAAMIDNGMGEEVNRALDIINERHKKEREGQE